MRHRCRHHSAPVPTPQTRPPHMLSGQVSVVPRAPVAPGTQLPPALSDSAHDAVVAKMEITCARDHTNAKAVRWGEQVGRTAPVPGCPTSRRAGMDGLLHVAAYHRLRPCSCCDDAPPTAPPVPPIITGCCPRALAAGWAWRYTQRQDCRGRAVQRCRGVGRCVGGRTPSSHSQLRPPAAAACCAADDSCTICCSTVHCPTYLSDWQYNVQYLALHS